MSIDFGALAGTVTKDLAAAAQEVHDEASADLDAFRTALPGITAAAHQHIDEVATAMISWGESHLAKLRAAFGLPDPATGQPTPVVSPAAPADPAAVPTPDPTVAPSTTQGSAPSSDTSSTTTASETPASA
ncbi:MAG TPA: hypothetical protein VGG83_10805 [Trebonia sp.]|jgi:hypothetical protein